MNEKKIIIGLWQLSKGHGEDSGEYKDLINEYIQEGYTTFDCADIYEGTEELLGKIRGKENLCINTKHVPDLSKVLDGTITDEYVKGLILRSQKRLCLKSLDNVQFHWWDYDKNGYKIVIKALIDIQKDGGIKRIGITNTNTDFLLKLQDECDFIPYSTQNQYSIIDRRVEKKLLPFIQENDVKLFCYGSLMGGLLTNRYLGIGRPQEPLENRSLRKYLLIIDDWGNWNLFQTLLERLQGIGVKYNKTIAQVAIAWILGREGVTSAILGISKSGAKGPYDDFSQCFLDQKDYALIDEIYNKGAPLEGDVFDSERYSERHKNIMKFNLNKKYRLGKVNQIK